MKNPIATSSMSTSVIVGTLCNQMISFLVEWDPPSGWTGAHVALYRSLDSVEGLVLMEGTSENAFDALVCGKVGAFLPSTISTYHKYLLSTDHYHYQFRKYV